MIKTTALHETSDGLQFNDLDTAVRHERYLLLCAALLQHPELRDAPPADVCSFASMVVTVYPAIRAVMDVDMTIDTGVTTMKLGPIDPQSLRDFFFGGEGQPVESVTREEQPAPAPAPTPARTYAERAADRRAAGPGPVRTHAEKASDELSDSLGLPRRELNGRGGQTADEILASGVTSRSSAERASATDRLRAVGRGERQASTDPADAPQPRA